MLLGVRDRVPEMKNSGMSEDAVVAAEPTVEWDPEWKRPGAEE